MPSSRKLLWIPASPTGRGILPLEGERPTQLWTLPSARSEEDRPSIPPLVHLRGAFLEDPGHDWKIFGGDLLYFSRLDIRERGVWVVLVFEGE